MTSRASSPSGSTRRADAGTARALTRPSFTAAELARELGARVRGDPNVVLDALAPLDAAQSGSLSHVSSIAWRDRLADTAASAVIVHPDLADAVALLLSELPENYDLLYLCVPPRYAVDQNGDGRVVRASCPSLSAYVASRRACGTLLDLVRAGLDRPLGDAVAAAGLVTYAARAPPVVSLGMASSVASTPEFFPIPKDE